MNRHYYKTNAQNDSDHKRDQARLEELQLLAWVEVKYWVSKQLEAGATPTDIANKLGLTIQGYDLLLTDDHRAVHFHTVNVANGRVKAFEGRFEEGYSEFAKSLLARRVNR